VLDARLRHDEQQRHRGELQRQLEATNERLRAKIDELEQVAAALIEREERMIELEAEIARLGRS
jgi:hypothetical protein